MGGGQISFGRTLVVAPHPDDEVLGAGGTIARLAAEGEEVFVAVVTEESLLPSIRRQLPGYRQKRGKRTAPWA